MAEYSQEERDLINRLSSPPKCMHDPKQCLTDKDEEGAEYWVCGQCGIWARKSEWDCFDPLKGIFFTTRTIYNDR